MKEQQKPNLLKPEIQKYQTYLTEQEVNELRAYGKETGKFLKAFFSKNKQLSKS